MMMNTTQGKPIADWKFEIFFSSSYMRTTIAYAAGFVAGVDITSSQWLDSWVRLNHLGLKYLWTKKFISSYTNTVRNH